MSALFPPVTVNGHTIAAAEIAAEAQNHAAPKGKPGIAWRKAARALIVRHLLLQEAVGIDAEPQELAPGKVETAEEAAMQALLDHVIAPEPATEANLRVIYDRNREEFRAPSLYEAAHILFAARPDDAAARSTAMEQAESVLGLLASFPDAFGKVASSQSACSSRANGGQLGQIATGDTVPEFETALDALEIGQIASSPVSTRYGIHVIRLDAKAEGAQLPFDAVRAEISKTCEKTAWAKAAQRYIADLLGAAEISGLNLDIVA